ncbi:MAG: thioredoxin domain-containing protein [Acidimicrobiia bacterium]
MPNRLVDATSPYLLQHADNPVDWFEWGDEAFVEARRRDVPIFLSVGYSSCHWCHVMAHESFEDPTTAAEMNAAFVNVKVDREERPDVDAIYMNAVQGMTGRGGWPMSVWLTPDGEPFFAGTYFPAEPRHGMRSFRQVVAAVGATWDRQREEVAGQAARLTAAIGRTLPAGDAPVDDDALAAAYGRIVGQADRTFGGFGGAPKFPQAPVLDFLARVADRPWAPEARPIVAATLDAMAAGGLRDHVGGGFARYSVDARWEIPHFEKMLYDNAQLIRLYLRSWQAGGPDRHRDVAVSTIEYVLRDLKLDGGAFASAEDADSEGEEGLFYTWTLDEVRAVTGDDAPVAEALWGITASGNFEGRNHLRVVATVADVAERLGMTPDEVRDAAGRALGALFAARSSRVRPGLDDKVVVGWNGLMIRALAEAGALLGEPGYLDAATRAADFVLTEAARPDGRLHRTWAKGRPGPAGVLEDHASMAMAAFTLYQSTGDGRWYARAERLTRLIPEWFTADGALYATAHDVDDLVVRPTDQMDNPSPSGSSLATEALWTLALYTGEAALSDAAESAVAEASLLVDRYPSAVGHLMAVVASLSDAREVAVVGPDADRVAAPVRRALPHDVVLATSTDGVESIPLLADRHREDETLAYVCRRFVCDRPVASAEELAESLGL